MAIENTLGTLSVKVVRPRTPPIESVTITMSGPEAFALRKALGNERSHLARSRLALPIGSADAHFDLVNGLLRLLDRGLEGGL